MDNVGFFGPFKDLDEVKQTWYLFEEKQLKKWILETKEELKGENSQDDIVIYKNDIKNWTNELKNLQNFVDNYHRCLERYRYDQNILNQIQQDWENYNMSLYSGFIRIQAIMVAPSEESKNDQEKNIKRSREEKIIREEIEKRVEKLLK